MTTRKPRMTIEFDPEMDAVVTTMSLDTGKSVETILNELIKTGLPKEGMSE